MSVAILLEDLLKADPEDAPMIRELVAKRKKDGLMGILSSRIACLMDPESFIQALEKGDVASVLAASKRASEIKRLRDVVFKDF